MHLMQQHNISNSNTTMVSSLEAKLSSGLLGVCFLLGVPGNISVVAFILRLNKKDNFTLNLMLNLAAADLLSLLQAPFVIYNLLAGWYIGDFLCKAISFFWYLSMCVSLLTIMLISVHRYLFVMHQNIWARLGPRGERVLLGALWFTACVCCPGFIGTYGVKQDGTKYICWRIDLVDKDRVTLLLIEIVFIFILPISVITTSYCCLHRSVNQTVFFSRHPDHSRLTRLVTCIVVTFLILWVPLHTVSLLEVFAISVKSQNFGLYTKLMEVKRVLRPVESLIFINSCVNPFLYAFNYRSLRQNNSSSGEVVNCHETEENAHQP